jgi:hypothetical protein
MTINEIDTLLVAAYWRCLHAQWSGTTLDLEAARAEQDSLLDERYVLMFHGAAEQARTVTRQAA